MRLIKICCVSAALCLAAVVLAACGSSGEDSGSTGAAATSAATSAAASEGLSAETREAIEAGFEGSFAAPPSESPKPQAGKNVWFIPIASSVMNFRAPGSLHDAASRLGWEITEVDGRYSPDTIVNGIRQAVADKADGILLYIVDCVELKAGLQDAERAGIPVVTSASTDCDQSRSGPPLFDAEVRYRNSEQPDVPMRYLDFVSNEWAKNVALALTNGTEGRGKIIDVYESDLLVTVEQDRGVRKYLEQYCPGCEIVETVEHTGAEIGPPLQAKIEQALAQHPEANAMFNPYDAVTQVSMSALQAAGRTDDVYNVGAEGEPAVLDALRARKGTVKAEVGLSGTWEQYALLDALNRLLAGDRQPRDGWATGNGTQIITAERNLEDTPPGERYQPPVDFRADYMKAWGAQ